MVTLQLVYKKSSISDRETISSTTNKLMTPSEGDAIIFGATENIYKSFIQPNKLYLFFSISVMQNLDSHIPYMLVYKCDY